jgi:predicted negative regulator of RcsB-dependent stress response
VLLLATAGSYLTGTFLFSGARTGKTGLPAASLGNTVLDNQEDTGLHIATVDPNNAAESPESAAINALILAEIAQNNDDYPLALTYYKQALSASHSPEVAHAATELALEVDEPETALDFAQRWADLAPNDLSAQLVAMTVILPTDSVLAQHYLTQALISNPNQLASHLSIIQSRLPENGRSLLYQSVIKLAEQQINSPDAQYLAAQSALYEQDFEHAKTYLQATFRLMPTMTKAIELQAKLIRFHDTNDKKALAYLREQVHKLPNDDDLRAFYAHALLDSKNYSEAIKQLEPLLQKEQYKSITPILLGEVYHLMGNETTALKYITQALDFPEHRSAAHYLIGEIYQKQNNLTLALTHFSTVTEGEYYVPAILNSAVILNKNQQFDDALELLRGADPSDFHEQKQLLLLEIKTLINAKNIAEANELLSHILKNLPEDPDFLQQKKAIELNKIPEINAQPEILPQVVAP